MDKGFGASTNICINTGIMMITILGVGNPEHEYEDLKASSYWRFIYFFPVIPSTISILMFLFVHREDSLMYCLQNDMEDEYKNQVAKIYRDEDENTRDQIIANLKAQV